jgi:hypothetical protein
VSRVVGVAIREGDIKALVFRVFIGKWLKTKGKKV